jgi:hypothetical protein
MDAFTIYLRGECSDAEVCAAIRALGAEVLCRAAGDIAASRQEAHVWIEHNFVSNLPSSVLNWQQAWRFPKEEVGSVLSVLVSRRNEESTFLALEIAHELVTRLDGAISWNGIDYWERLYNQTYKHERK